MRYRTIIGEKNWIKTVFVREVTSFLTQRGQARKEVAPRKIETVARCIKSFNSLIIITYKIKD